MAWSASSWQIPASISSSSSLGLIQDMLQTSIFSLLPLSSLLLLRSCSYLEKYWIFAIKTLQCSQSASTSTCLPTAYRRNNIHRDSLLLWPCPTADGQTWINWSNSRERKKDFNSLETRSGNGKLTKKQILTYTVLCLFGGFLLLH